MKILSFLDQKTVEDSVKAQKYELLPAVKYVDIKYDTSTRFPELTTFSELKIYSVHETRCQAQIFFYGRCLSTRE